MRQRNIKNKQEIIDRCRRFIVEDPTGQKGRWSQRFLKPGDVYVEIGSGKGRFITQMAQRYPQHNFIAVERGPNVAIRTLEKAEATDASNLLVVAAHIDSVRDWFAEGEIAGLYLNFSDPWPKARHAKRRLTHRARLLQYRCIAAPGALLYFQTDDASFFAFSMEEFAAAGLTDVIASGRKEDILRQADDIFLLPETEYEGKARRLCRSVYAACVRLRPSDAGASCVTGRAEFRRTVRVVEKQEERV